LRGDGSGTIDIQLSTGGGNSYFNSPGASVGVGTSSPTEKLHVAGSGIITGDLDVQGASLTAPTGTFATSLTVSGIPVNIGAAGSGNINDINAQTGPSVTVTGVGAVHTTTDSNVVTISGANYSLTRVFRYTGTGSSGNQVTLPGINRAEYIVGNLHNNDGAVDFWISIPDGDTGDIPLRTTGAGASSEINLSAPSAGSNQILTINSTGSAINTSGKPYRVMVIGVGT
ncbi:hypothetical protein LCGC14_2148790, partial [marine sediment metagenome]